LAAAAIEQYDTDGNGVIDGNEIKAAPSLNFSLGGIDANGDGQIDASEIEAFAQKHWADEEGAGIIRIRCSVSLDGRPLDGATVTFEPEAFMQDAVVPASGVTRGGVANIAVSDEDRPHENARGVQPGMYLVRVSKQAGGRETIPSKYNESTTLGCNVAYRASYMPGPVRFELRSR
jgi:hypothetical protein